MYHHLSCCNLIIPISKDDHTTDNIPFKTLVDDTYDKADGSVSSVDESNHDVDYRGRSWCWN
jgi:hypothetical protein